MPLEISKNNVSPATNLLPDLKTLVAPMFLEPTFLISFFKKILKSIKPKGIEPDKQDNRNTSNISMVTVN